MVIQSLFAAASLLLLAAPFLLLYRRRRRWCSCDVCRAYITSSWSAEFANIGDWYASLLRASPTGTVTVHVLGATVTANPGNVEHMLRTRFGNFPKGKQFASILGDLLGSGIFNVDGEAWLQQRKLASLALGSRAVRRHAFQIVMAEVVGRLLPLLAGIADRGGDAVDMQEILRRFAFDAICKISFGLDPENLDLDVPVADLVAAFDVASQLSARRAATVAPFVWKAKRLLNIGSERELRRSIQVVDKLAAAVIRQRRKLGVDDSHDLLSRFMAHIDDDKVNSDKYLRDIVVSFLIAGRDTVSSALTTFFLLMAKNPSALAVLRGEIDGAAAAAGEALSYEQVKGMHYAHAAMYESMRLYPPVQFDSKFSVDDDVLPDGTFVPAGERVMYHPYAMGRMPAIWGADYGEYRPARWLDGRGAFVPESLYRYPVFQAGLRVCVGKEIALLEIKAVALSVLRQFDIELVSAVDGEPTFAPGLTASIRGGLMVRVRRRLRPV